MGQHYFDAYIQTDLAGDFACALAAVLSLSTAQAAPAPTPQADSQPAPDERDDFEKVFPLPSGCIRVGTGYASTGYSNWAAHTHCERWQGWQARAARAPADSVTAPAAGAVAVPRETLVAWRQWCAQSMSHAIEHEISDWLAAAPTPAAQADSVPQKETPDETLWQWYLANKGVEIPHSRAIALRVLQGAIRVFGNADSVLEDAASEAIDKVLALFPFDARTQQFHVNSGPPLKADGDTLFYSAAKVLEFITEIHAVLDAARKQGAKHD